jgi:taurine dioxygenase
MIDLSETGLSFRPLPVGAEVIGLDPDAEAQGAIRRALHAAWLQYGVLLFRGVGTNERQLAISRCFGELEVHPVPEIRVEGEPHLVAFGGAKRAIAYVYDGAVRAGRIPWHRDTAFTPEVCKGGMLRMVQPTRVAGETMLADTARAYEDLSPRLKARIDRLEYKTSMKSDPLTQLGPGSFWRTVRLPTQEEEPDLGSRAVIQNRQHLYPSVIHPVVLQHPETGRSCIFITPRDFDCFLGMSRSESDELLQELVEHMLQPEYTYTHRWSADDALLWDNLRCMHAACGYEPTETRYALRTTLAGSLHTGRYFDQSPDGAAEDSRVGGRVG